MKNKWFKRLFLGLFIVFVLFLGLNSTFAAQKKYKWYDVEYTYDDASDAIYCGHSKDWIGGKEFKGCAIVTKNGIIENPDTPKVVQYRTSISLQKNNGTNVTAYVITTKDDEVYKDKKKWWETLQLCGTNSASTASLNLYTDALSTDTEQFQGFFKGKGRCVTLTGKDIPKEKIVNSCPKLIERYNKIENYKKAYQQSKNSKYITKYKNSLEEIKALCAEVVKFSDWNEACTSKCINLSEDIHNWNKDFDVSDNSECGFSSRFIEWIMNIIRWIKYIIPVAVIVLGMLDFIKATGSDKDDEMKKAQGRFIRRLIAAALIFLVPLLVEFILPKLGFDYNSCGIF